MGGAAEAAAEAQTRLQERGGGSIVLGAAGSTIEAFNRAGGGAIPSEAPDLRSRQLSAFGKNAAGRVRAALQAELQQRVASGEISRERAETALAQFEQVAGDEDTTVRQAILQAEAGIGPDVQDLELADTIRSALGGAGGDVTIINNAQQFNSTKDPSTGDLDAAAKGERPQ
jgi:hypothetical protein